MLFLVCARRRPCSLFFFFPFQTPSKESSRPRSFSNDGCTHTHTQTDGALLVSLTMPSKTAGRQTARRYRLSLRYDPFFLSPPPFSFLFLSLCSFCRVVFLQSEKKKKEDKRFEEFKARRRRARRNTISMATDASLDKRKVPSGVCPAWSTILVGHLVFWAGRKTKRLWVPRHRQAPVSTSHRANRPRSKRYTIATGKKREKGKKSGSYTLFEGASRGREKKTHTHSFSFVRPPYSNRPLFRRLDSPTGAAWETGAQWRGRRRCCTLA